MLNFYQKRPVFTLKIHPRPQMPKRPMKASKGMYSPFYLLLPSKMATVAEKACYLNQFSTRLQNHEKWLVNDLDTITSIHSWIARENKTDILVHALLHLI